MKHIRITHKKGLFLGSGFHPRGAIVEVPDDRRAAQLVAAGVAEHVLAAGDGDPHKQERSRATARAAPERAARQ